MPIPESFTDPQARFLEKHPVYVPVRFKITNAEKDSDYFNVGWTGHLETECREYNTFSYQVIDAETNEVIAEETADSIEDRGWGHVTDLLGDYDFEYGDVNITMRAKQMLDEVHEVFILNLYEYQCNGSAPSDDYPSYKYAGFRRAFFNAFIPRG